jgi:S-adenosylmethionine synthetase
MTKYDMCKIIGQHLGQPIDHIIPDTQKPVDGTPRPDDCTLSLKILEDIGVDTSEDLDFSSWWAKYAKEAK